MRDDEPLLRWQWRGYARNHQHPRNLLLHIVAVPMFMAGTVLGLYGLLRLNLPAIALGLVCMGMSMALQGRGHRLETHAPEPFAGPADIAGRILAEQWITFPRYVLSGQWWRALAGRSAAPAAAAAPAPARSGDVSGQGG